MTHAEVILVRDGREVLLGAVGHGHLCELDLIHVLARVQVAARRHGWSIRLRRTSSGLSGLITLTGLDHVLPHEPHVR